MNPVRSLVAEARRSRSALLVRPARRVPRYRGRPRPSIQRELVDQFAGDPHRPIVGRVDGQPVGDLGLQAGEGKEGSAWDPDGARRVADWASKAGVANYSVVKYFSMTGGSRVSG